MPIIQINLARPHINQRTILEHPARYRVAACGRRFGKTELAKQALLRHALAGKRCWWTAPTHPMASDVWRDLKYTLRPLNCEVNEAERFILLPTRGYIAVRSTAAFDNLRGSGLDFVVLDEAAYMHPDVWPSVLRPMLLERQGGALFISTPNGRNWFWEVYALGLDPQETEWKSFHYTSYDNPLVKNDEIEAIQRNTPTRIFDEEYRAEFLEGSGQVFRNIRENATAPLNAQPQAGHRYVMGVDWAKDNDFTVAIVIDDTTRQVVAMDRFNQIGWYVQRGRLRALYDVWKPSVMIAEENSIGGPNIEELQREGLPVRAFQTTNASKGDIIESLALAFEQGTIKIVPDEALVNELTAYRLEKLPGGAYRYSAPDGLHDDTVMALALAWSAVQTARIAMPIILG